MATIQASITGVEVHGAVSWQRPGWAGISAFSALDTFVGIDVDGSGEGKAFTQIVEEEVRQLDAERAFALEERDDVIEVTDGKADLDIQ